MDETQSDQSLTRAAGMTDDTASMSMSTSQHEKKHHFRHRGPDSEQQDLRWLHMRNMTFLPNAEVEQPVGTRKYLVRRPRPLQWYKGDTYIDHHGQTKGPADVERLTSTISSDEERERLLSEHRIDDIPILVRVRLDLFIDLVWVAVISNISETFSISAFEGQEPNYGYAFLVFITLFTLSYRIWDQLRNFLNSYFNGDILQGGFIMWILILALAFGNNALPREGHRPNFNFLVVIVLISKASFWLIDLVYSSIAKEFRANFLLSNLLLIPPSGLLIGSMWVDWPHKSILILCATFWESFVPTIIISPLGRAVLGDRAVKAIDFDHYTERLSNFFLIIVGEGVFLLIKNGPLGKGVKEGFGAGSTALIIYYLIAQLYFNGDQTKKYIHAVKRNKYGAYLFTFFHMTLYSSLLIFDAGILYLVTYVTKSATQSTTTESSSGTSTTGETTSSSSSSISERAEEATSGDSAPPEASYQHGARWITGSSLSIVLFSMTIIALLHQPVKDTSSPLRVNSRWLRLMPRIGAIVLFSCLPLVSSMNGDVFIGILAGVMGAVTVWEYVAGSEKNGKVVEPKDHDDEHEPPRHQHLVN